MGMKETFLTDRIVHARALTLSAVALGVMVALNPAGATEAEGRLRDQALRLASARHGIALEELSIINSAQVEFPRFGMKVFKAKVLTSKGDVVGVNVDPTGAEVSEEQLAQYAEPHDAHGGRIHPQLARQMRGARPHDKLRVILWLHEPDQAGASRPDAHEEASLPGDSLAKTVFVRADTQRAATVERLAAPVLRSLRQFDADAQGDRYAPAIYATLPAAAIARVARWTEVAAVYKDEVDKPDLDMARKVIQANVVHTLGTTGFGIRVAQIEVGGRVATANPSLNGVVQDGPFVCIAASDHSTGVAGIIRSTHATVRGIAPDVTLWAGGSCFGLESELLNRSTAAADWGASVLNLSWGYDNDLVPSATDRFYDDMVFNRWRTVVKSAGNEAGLCNSGTEHVTSPGLAYNVITVGNFDDKNTNSWTDDSMSSCSSWRDPVSTHGDREKPEVAAPGTNITSTTTASPWTGGIGSGTSFATPMVTGTVALMMDRRASLVFWPEAVKAILMVTAGHNIEGNARLSEYDGAGGVVADRAVVVASNRQTAGNFGWEAVTYGCSEPVNRDVAVMALTAGIRTRAAIVWNQNPSYASYASQPSADLDLNVLGPSGSLVSSSMSWDNTYEIVDFTPTVSGNYTLRVKRFRCDLTPRAVGFAWRTGN